MIRVQLLARAKILSSSPPHQEYFWGPSNLPIKGLFLLGVMWLGYEADRHLHDMVLK